MTQQAIDIYNEGYYHYTGTNGRVLDYSKAFEYFQKAAELGVSHAMNYLGIMYEKGRGVPFSYERAFEWFIKAGKADTGNPHAAYNAARMLYDGTGVAKNMDRAFEFFKCAAMLGIGNTHSVYPQCCFYAGCILMDHYKNNAEAYAYFSEAAKYGNMPGAWHNLGWLTELGVGSSSSSGERDGKAMQFYETAANLGFAQSMDAMGRLYIGRDMQKARYWLEKAAALGYEPARHRLAAFNSGSIFGSFKALKSLRDSLKKK